MGQQNRPTPENRPSSLQDLGCTMNGLFNRWWRSRDTFLSNRGKVKVRMMRSMASSFYPLPAIFVPRLSQQALDPLPLFHRSILTLQNLPHLLLLLYASLPSPTHTVAKIGKTLQQRQEALLLELLDQLHLLNALVNRLVQRWVVAKHVLSVFANHIPLEESAKHLRALARDQDATLRRTASCSRSSARSWRTKCSPRWLCAGCP